MTLLVVAEDDDDIRLITTRLLRKAGFTVIETADGAAALRAVRKHRPAAVVSEIDMPAMSGVDLCRALRGDETTKDLPVIFVSGSLMPGDPARPRPQATAMLSKPLLTHDLVACVEKVLQTGHQDGEPPMMYP